jgi:UDP-N-acetylglucosamine 2-epimerase (non-hydrolysing)
VKILTILGTRPEIIRLSRIIPLLDETVGRENHCLVHTGQNYDLNLYMQFFYDLGLRHPDVQLKMEGSFGEQVGQILPQIERTLLNFNPDRVLILGDTNSSLTAIVAARAGIPVYHMEAGNRCYDPRSPEEINRRLIDHASSVLLPYTERSRQNLLAEGIEGRRIFVTGNPIHEAIERYRTQWEQPDAQVWLARLGLRARKFFLVTLHRAENVDDIERLFQFISVFSRLYYQYQMPVIVSTHPHLRQRMDQELAKRSLRLPNPNVHFFDPFSFFDFLGLQSQAFCTLSDSGTVQEESCILHTPSVALRDHTERLETVECGASVLSGCDPERILALVKQVTSQPTNWNPPPEYLRTNVAETVVRILTSHHERQVR